MVDVQAFAAGDLEAAGVEAELVQEGRVDVGDVVAVFGSVEADLVGGSVHDALAQSAAGHPDAESEDVVVAAVGPLVGIPLFWARIHR